MPALEIAGFQSEVDEESAVETQEPLRVYFYLTGYIVSHLSFVLYSVIVCSPCFVNIESWS